MIGYEVPRLIFETIRAVRERHRDRPALVGVGGAQGSGKTTICQLLEASNRPRFAHFSLDDVYLTRAERERLARELHPLFITRGPPGTHDLDLARRTIESLSKPGPTRLPRFDKRADDRAPEAAWPLFQGPAEAILVDGWCMGAREPLEPIQPAINALERDDDPNGAWRRLVFGNLATVYRPFFAAFDAMIYLQAPSWEIVRAWRGQQEEETLGRALTPQENAALDRFVMHYERITRSMLAGHHMAKWIAHLDEARNVVRVEERE